MNAEEFKALLPEPDGWDSIDLIFSPDDLSADELRHVVAWVTGPSKAGCLKGARTVLDVVRGKWAFVRVPPEADSQYDIDFQAWRHRGYVRFSFKDEPGDWLTRETLPMEDGASRFFGLRARTTPPAVPFVPDW